MKTSSKYYEHCLDQVINFAKLATEEEDFDKKTKLISDVLHWAIEAQIEHDILDSMQEPETNEN